MTSPVFPLAERLMRRGIPVALVTGYDRAVLPVQFRGLPHLGKPVQFCSLEAAFDAMLRFGAEAGV